MVVDIETSGVDVRRHGILSIGAVDFSMPGNTFYGECRLRTGASLDEDALAYNGFSKAYIRSDERITEGALMKRFAEWMKGVKDTTIAGHNVHFDLSFLRKAAKAHRVNISFGNRIVDMHTLAYASLAGRGMEVPLQMNRTAITSDFVFRYVGLHDEPRPHNALTGAKMEAEALSRLIYGRCLLEEYSGLKIPVHLLHTVHRKIPKP